MLHMVVATHSPANCPMVDKASGQKLLSANQRSAEVGKKLGATLQGSWTDMPAHITFMLVDAPNAHVVNQMAIELKMMDWNTVVVYAVVTAQEAMANLK
jgi:hypothetical protein